jgi:hypothetical protein
LIGNGPSLDNIDLDLFKNRITFAVNRIHLKYDSTDWRPTYYVIEDFDERNWSKMFKEAEWHSKQGYECWFREDIRDEYPIDWPDHVHFFPKCDPPHPRDNERGFGDDRRRWHLPEICVVGGSGIVSIQVAILKGYNPIYLVGHDGDYVLGHGSNFKGYVADGLGKEFYIQQRNKRLAQAHDACWHWCQEHDIKIYQTNPHSAFTQYPVVGLGELK